MLSWIIYVTIQGLQARFWLLETVGKWQDTQIIGVVIGINAAILAIGVPMSQNILRRVSERFRRPALTKLLRKRVHFRLVFGCSLASTIVTLALPLVPKADLQAVYASLILVEVFLFLALLAAFAAQIIAIFGVVDSPLQALRDEVNRLQKKLS